MINIVDKVIKLCDNICKGVYDIESLSVHNNKSILYFNNISITTYSGKLAIHTNKGGIEVKINEVDRAKLLIAFTDVLKYSEILVNNTIDEFLNFKEHKISNINELDCNN